MPQRAMSQITTSSRLRILVPMDFSEAARLALKTALRLAQPPDDVVHVIYTPGLYTKSTEDAELGQPISQQRGSWRKRFLAWTELEGLGVGVEMLTQIARADAVTIADTASRMGTTLILLIRRKYTFWERLLGRCPTEELPRIAPCQTHFVDAPDLSR